MLQRKCALYLVRTHRYLLKEQNDAIGGSSDDDVEMKYGALIQIWKLCWQVKPLCQLCSPPIIKIVITIDGNYKDNLELHIWFSDVLVEATYFEIVVRVI